MPESKQRPPDAIEQDIAARFREHFRVLDAMDAEIMKMLKHHDGKLRADNASQIAVGFLFGKSLKSMDAARLLASKGYGEDSLILLRTVLEALFSAAYITDTDPEERAKNWIADGYQEQVAFLGKFPEEPPPPWVGRWDPAEVKKRAARWPHIRERAEKSGLSKLSQKEYPFLCSLAHSDAWSSLTYLDDKEGFQVRTEPSIKHVDIALLVAAALLPPLTECFCRAFGIIADEQATLRRLGELLGEIIPADSLSGG